MVACLRGAGQPLAALLLAATLTGCGDDPAGRDARPRYTSETAFRDVHPCVLLDQQALDVVFGEGSFVEPEFTSTQSGSPACQAHPQGSQQEYLSVVIVQRRGNAASFAEAVQPFVGYTPDVGSVPGPWDASLGRCTERACVLYVLKGQVIVGHILQGNYVEEEARALAEQTMKKFG